MARPPLRGRNLLSAVTATALLVVGCQAGRAQQEPPERLQLSVEAGYGRHAAVRERADLRVANSGAGPVEVLTYQVRHPMFEVLPPTERTSTLPADGRPRIVPVPFGAPRCEVADPAGAHVVLGVADGGEAREVAVPLTDGRPGLVARHQASCAADALRAVATFTLGPPWVREDGPDGPRLHTALRLERHARGTVRVPQVVGSILFTVRVEVEPVLGPGADAVAVPVVLTAERCDRHALIESKTSATFPLFAAVDDAEPVRLTVTPDAPGRAALQSLLDASCGGG